MENFYPPPGGEPGDSQPTEQFWHGQDTPGPHHGYGDPRYGDPRSGDPRSGQHWQQRPGLQAHLTKDRHKALHWTVGLLAAALLAGGGALAGMSLAGNSLSSAPAANTGSTTGGGTGTGSQAGQAGLLAATLSAASAPDAAVSATAPATGTAPGAGPAARRCAHAAGAAGAARRTGHQQVANAARAATSRCRFIRRHIVRFFLLRGVDGQFTFRTASGALKTLAYERGVIQSVSSGSSIVVKAADGTTWTWDLVAKTVVRDSSGKISASSLAAGEPVWVGGPVISGAKDARLIFARPPSGTS
jgi:hypothetical protein